MKTKIFVGSDFSGIGAFDYAIKRISEKQNFEIENVFACDMDKFARISYLENHKKPNDYPKNVYERNIPKEPLDIYMTSPPCQAFSIAGKRLGKEDKRGILFFNSLEFIQKNKPRFFIFENVKGLISHDEGKTFSEWINLLSGKSINGQPVLFPYENSVPYHIYYDVMNSKNFNVPQNRERIFIIGIRDDKDNDFRFPKEEHLSKKLLNLLENCVDQKYFLSEKMINYIMKNGTKNYSVKPELITEKSKIAFAITTKQDKRAGITNYIKIKSANSKGYEEAKKGDSINYSLPNSETRRGRVGKGVAQTLDTGCQQGVLIDDYKIRRLTPRECLRLMDFPEEFKIVVSDAQIYKQAGNSIVVRVLEKILSNLKIINK